jgi:hypothetical protein
VGDTITLSMKPAYLAKSGLAPAVRVVTARPLPAA